MAVLVAGIDASGAAKGANDFSAGAKKVKDEAAGVDNAVKKTDSLFDKFSGTLEQNSFAIQQAGFQVGDLAVQLAAGANPIVALTQQGSQMLGAFQPMGAVLSAVGAIAGAVAVAMFNMGEDTEEATESLEVLDERLNVIQESMKRIQGEAELTGDALRANIRNAVGLIEFDLIELQRQLEEATRLQEDLFTLESGQGTPVSSEMERLQQASKDVVLQLTIARALAGEFGDRFSVSMRDSAEAIEHVTDLEAKRQRAAERAAKARERELERERKAVERLAAADERRFNRQLAMQERQEQSLADRIIERNLTAQERYNRSLNELFSIRERLTQQQFTREFERLTEELQKADPLFQSVSQTFQQLGSAGATAMSQAAAGTIKWSEALDRVAASMLEIAARAAQEEVFKALFSGIAGLFAPEAGATITRTGTTVVGPPIDLTGGLSAQPDAAPAGRSPTIIVNISEAEPGTNATVSQVDPDTFQIDVFKEEIASDIRSRGIVGEAIEQTFDSQRQRRRI